MSIILMYIFQDKLLFIIFLCLIDLSWGSWSISIYAWVKSDVRIVGLRFFFFFFFWGGGRGEGGLIINCIKLNLVVYRIIWDPAFRLPLSFFKAFTDKIHVTSEHGDSRRPSIVEWIFNFILIAHFIFAFYIPNILGWEILLAFLVNLERLWTFK